MFATRKSYNAHRCALPRHERLYHDYTPYDTRFQHLCKWLKQSITIRRNSISKRYFSSSAGFRAEKKRHLQTPEYKWILHPLSNLAQRRELFMSFIWFNLFLIESVMGSFVESQGTDIVFMQNILFVGNFIALLDIIGRFFTGYIIERTREVVLRPRDIMKSYFKTYFVVDVLSVWAFFNNFFFQNLLGDKIKLLVYQVHRMRLFRMKTMLESLNHVITKLGLGDARRFLVLLMFAAAMFLHILTCLTRQINTFKLTYNLSTDTSWVHKYHVAVQEHASLNATTKLTRIVHRYVLNMAVVTCHFFGAGYYRYPIKDSFEMFYFACVLMIGVTFYVYCLAKILQFYKVINIGETQYENLLVEAEQYMLRKEFSQSLRKRIFLYYEHKMNKNYFEEEKIANSLTEHLRMEVLLYSCKHLLQKVQIFRGLSKAAVGTMLALLQKEIYVAGNEIKPIGDDSGSIYFILHGTCGIKAENGKEVTHMEDGDYFGDTSQVLQSAGGQMLYSVVALEVSEVYKLEKKDIEYCLDTHPEIVDKMQTIFRAKARELDLIFSLRCGSEDKTEGIIQDLRRGKILFQGIMRSQFGF